MQTEKKPQNDKENCKKKFMNVSDNKQWIYPSTPSPNCEFRFGACPKLPVTIRPTFNEKN